MYCHMLNTGILACELSYVQENFAREEFSKVLHLRLYIAICLVYPNFYLKLHSFGNTCMTFVWNIFQVNKITRSILHLFSLFLDALHLAKKDNWKVRLHKVFRFEQFLKTLFNQVSCISVRSVPSFY